MVIDGAGHLPNLEAERQFNEALRGFLQAHAPGGPPLVGRLPPPAVTDNPNPGKSGKDSREGRRMAAKGGTLAGLDLSLKLTPRQEEVRLAAAQDRLLQLRLTLGGQIGEKPQLGPPVCVLFEGWDASGKGGAIKRLVAPLDPRHVRVAQFGAPTYDEKRHHFLWRFWPALPGWGGMAVLDRSW